MEQSEETARWQDEFREHGYTHDRLLEKKPTCTVHLVQKENRRYQARVFLKKSFFVSPILKAQVNRELEVAEQVKSRFKYLVGYEDFFYSKTFLILVYEYCGTSTLRTLLMFGDIVMEEVYVLLKDLLGAIDDLKYLGFIHRYLCPDNIIITDKCLMKVGGFEFCEPHSHKKLPPPEHLHFCRHVKDPAFVSPEALFNQVCTFKASIYSLGAIFYSMLHRGASHLPGDIEQVKVKVRNNDVLLAVDDHVEDREELQALLLNLLKVDPHDRMSFVQIHDFITFKYLQVKKDEEAIRSRLSVKIRSIQERIQVNKLDTRKAGALNMDLKKYTSIFDSPLPAPAAMKKAFRIKDVGEKFLSQTILLANSFRKTDLDDEIQLKNFPVVCPLGPKTAAGQSRSNSRHVRLGAQRPLVVGRVGHSMSLTRVGWGHLTRSSDLHTNNN